MLDSLAPIEIAKNIGIRNRYLFEPYWATKMDKNPKRAPKTQSITVKLEIKQIGEKRIIIKIKILESFLF